LEWTKSLSGDRFLGLVGITNEFGEDIVARVAFWIGGGGC
jgi:hypothetical protein